jgi:hypothetical protein
MVSKVISMHLAAGDGTMSLRVDVATSSPPTFVTSGDVNLDIQARHRARSAPVALYIPK